MVWFGSTLFVFSANLKFCRNMRSCVKYHGHQIHMNPSKRKLVVFASVGSLFSWLADYGFPFYGLDKRREDNKNFFDKTIKQRNDRSNRWVIHLKRFTILCIQAFSFGVGIYWGIGWKTILVIQMTKWKQWKTTIQPWLFSNKKRWHARRGLQTHSPKTKRKSFSSWIGSEN